jgi:hypothetical protein
VVRGRNTVQKDSPGSGKENEDEEEEEEPSKRNRAAPQASKKNHTVSKDVRNVEQEDGDGTARLKTVKGMNTYRKASLRVWSQNPIIGNEGHEFHRGGTSE